MSHVKVNLFLGTGHLHRPVALSMNNRLKALRAELGWSQSELARRLDVSRQTINAIENGRYDPSLPLAFAMARLLGRRIEDIFQE